MIWREGIEEVRYSLDNIFLNYNFNLSISATVAQCLPLTKLRLSSDSCSGNSSCECLHLWRLSPNLLIRTLAALANTPTHHVSSSKTTTCVESAASAACGWLHLHRGGAHANGPTSRSPSRTAQRPKSPYCRSPSHGCQTYTRLIMTA